MRTSIKSLLTAAVFIPERNVSSITEAVEHLEDGVENAFNFSESLLLNLRGQERNIKELNASITFGVSLKILYICRMILFLSTNRSWTRKLSWPWDSEGTFRSSSQAATYPLVYHKQWRGFSLLPESTVFVANVLFNCYDFDCKHYLMPKTTHAQLLFIHFWHCFWFIFKKRRKALPLPLKKVSDSKNARWIDV